MVCPRVCPVFRSPPPYRRSNFLNNLGSFLKDRKSYQFTTCISSVVSNTFNVRPPEIFLFFLSWPQDNLDPFIWSFVGTGVDKGRRRNNHDPSKQTRPPQSKHDVPPPPPSPIKHVDPPVRNLEGVDKTQDLKLGQGRRRKNSRREGPEPDPRYRGLLFLSRSRH